MIIELDQKGLWDRPASGVGRFMDGIDQEKGGPPMRCGWYGRILEAATASISSGVASGQRWDACSM